MSSDRPHLYLAYGSNLHPLRLARRTPSCRLLGRASLPGFALRFHKRSDVDGSAKADACYTGRPRDQVHGVVYQLAAEEFPVLDRIEGIGAGYRLSVLEVDCAGERREVFLYTAVPSHLSPELRPFAWYRELVWRGARFHAMPEDYVHGIRQGPAMADPDPERDLHHRHLLEEMAGWSCS